MRPPFLLLCLLVATGSQANPNTETLTQQLKVLEQRVQQLEADTQTTHDQAAHDQHRLLEQSFANTTESRSQAIPQQRVYADRVEKVLKDFIEIDGYFRAGYGRNSQGGSQAGFKAPGAMAKYRLGNEAENFGELIFGKNIFLPGAFSLNDDMSPKQNHSGPVAHVQFRIDFFNAYDDYSTGSNTSVGLPEAWASLGQLLESQPQAKFWAGNRFYRRHDIGLNDFFFWNMSGGGAGVEDVKLGSGKLALAWVGTGATSGFTDLPQPDPENKAGFSKTNIDLRYYDLPLLGGQVELGLIYSRAKSGLNADGIKGPDTSGYAINVVHTLDNFISDDGANKLSLQYGTQAAKTFTSGFETVNINGGTFIQPDQENSWRFRLTENFTANINEHFSLGPVLMYQVTDFGGIFGKQHWYSAGVRPIAHFNERFSLATELGWDKVESRLFNGNGELYKLTIAPQVSLGNRFNSRPVIRLFATWAGWSDEFVGQVGGADYAGKSDGFSFGAQMETWW